MDFLKRRKSQVDGVGETVEKLCDDVQELLQEFDSLPELMADEPPGWGMEPNAHSPGWGTAFFVLMIARYYSAMHSVVDCDEVFNSWEPLHFLLYGSGVQTWEYRCEYALRSYLFLSLNAVIASPISFIFGSGECKVRVFYVVKLVLALISAVTEANLVYEVTERYGPRLGSYTLAILSFSSGCFNASTKLLPSTFSMYSITVTSTLLSAGKRPTLRITAAVLGVLVGNPLTVVAAAPLLIHSLMMDNAKTVFRTGFVVAILTVVSSILADSYFYGKWTWSVINLLYFSMNDRRSFLHKVEGPYFYLQSGFKDFNLALVFALLLPVLPLVSFDWKFGKLMTLFLPIYMWLGFISVQPHKDERFMYPVYPLICLAAAATIESFPDFFPASWKDHDHLSAVAEIAKTLRPVAVGTIMALSYCSTQALTRGYAAPAEVYNHLPHASSSSPVMRNTNKNVTVCVGSEFQRFPSSFFLPSPLYKIGWLDDGLEALHPFPLNLQAQGGTGTVTEYLNNNDRNSPNSFISAEGICDFVVELKLDRPGFYFRGDSEQIWQGVFESPFLDSKLSPPFYRRFFLPWLWGNMNKFGTYRLLINAPKCWIH